MREAHRPAALLAPISTWGKDCSWPDESLRAPWRQPFPVPVVGEVEGLGLHLKRESNGQESGKGPVSAHS